jgi:hypothetical protein
MPWVRKSTLEALERRAADRDKRASRQASAIHRLERMLSERRADREAIVAMNRVDEKRVETIVGLKHKVEFLAESNKKLRADNVELEVLRAITQKLRDDLNRKG